MKLLGWFKRKKPHENALKLEIEDEPKTMTQFYFLMERDVDNWTLRSHTKDKTIIIATHISGLRTSTCGHFSIEEDGPWLQWNPMKKRTQKLCRAIAKNKAQAYIEKNMTGGSKPERPPPV